MSSDRATENASPQPVRLLRLIASSPEAPPVTVMAWRRTGGIVGPVPTARTTDQKVSETEEITRLIETARHQGRAEGEAIGVQQAGQRLEPVIAGLSALLIELAHQRRRLRLEAEEDTVKLAIAIARRVLHRELSSDPEAMLGLVKAAFQKLSARETQRLRVSPQDAPVLEENRARLDLPPGLEIACDGSLNRGSAVFETLRGEVDASVDTQLGEIQRGLTDVMKRQTK